MGSKQPHCKQKEYKDDEEEVLTALFKRKGASCFNGSGNLLGHVHCEPGKEMKTLVMKIGRRFDCRRQDAGMRDGWRW
ncbi:hypothetical protein M5689_000446 [Euphorbia peplus]|nr:hypothetical protein M5689_000446 [Euphorbia peplus]